MSKKKQIDVGIIFSAAAMISEGNPEAFMAVLKCFIHAAQPEAPRWDKSAHHNDQHAAKARLLSRDHR